MSGRGYDPECDKLARYFLGDLGSAHHPRLVAELAQAIQDSVEDWLRSEANRFPSTPGLKTAIARLELSLTEWATLEALSDDPIALKARFGLAVAGVRLILTILPSDDPPAATARALLKQLEGGL